LHVDVEILGGARPSVERDRMSTHHDILNAMGIERVDELFEVAVCHARLSQGESSGGTLRLRTPAPPASALRTRNADPPPRLARAERARSSTRGRDDREPGCERWLSSARRVHT